MVKEQQYFAGTVLVGVQNKRLTVDVSNDFRQAIAEIVERRGHHLVLDMNLVEYMDSSGLGALVAILKSLHPEGTLKLCGVNEQVMSLVKLTQLSRVFDIYDDFDQALAA